MWTLVFLLPLAAAAVAPDSRIVGGANVDIADYPWQGSYRTGTGSHSCGCVAVGGQFALTAAHCGGREADSMEFGGSNRGGGIVWAIVSVHQNPNYGIGPGFSPNDISLVTASGTISGDNIAPASIPSDATNPGGTGWITGWGSTCGSCTLPTALQGVNIPIISDDLCDEMHGTSFQRDNMICVWDEGNQDKGACNGDSGGPLAVDGVIIGLTSWGRSGCLTTFPSAYNRVGAFHEWICAHSYGVSGC